MRGPCPLYESRKFVGAWELDLFSMASRLGSLGDSWGPCVHVMTGAQLPEANPRAGTKAGLNCLKSGSRTGQLQIQGPGLSVLEAALLVFGLTSRAFKLDTSRASGVTETAAPCNP